MTLVLLNDVDDSHMLHLFFVHVHAIMELRQSLRFGKLCLTKHKTNDQEQCLSASIRKKEDEERCASTGTLFS